MKAVLMMQAGGVEVLEYQELLEPQIQQGNELKIKIKAAGVNPIDTKVRSLAMFYPDKLPAVLGCDLAGEVVEIGAEVTQFKVGDKVWGCHGGLGAEQGNYAEYTVIDARHVSLMPKTSDFTHAAAAPLVLITAWGALFERGQLKAGETVLIQAGTGGVGHVAIQLAKIKGARVITTVSSEAKAAWVKSLGADEVIIYPEEDVIERTLQLTDGKGVDLSFDTVGGEVLEQCTSLTAHYGRLVTLLSAEGIDLSEARMRNLSLAFELMLTPMIRQLDAARAQHINILNQCAEYIDQKQLQLHLAQVFSLSEAKAAHTAIEAGHTQGKYVLDCVQV